MTVKGISSCFSTVLKKPRAYARAVDLLTLTADELQGLLAGGHITSAEITVKYLDQIEKHNHKGLKLNAVITVASKELAVAYARDLDDERKNGQLRGPFHGIPLLVKDCYCTPSVGLPTTCGSHALLNAKARANAKVIDKLLAAGMIIIAKANLSEWGNMKGHGLTAGWSALGGQTQTPYVQGGLHANSTWLSSWGPAGSSSGSAAGVAAGFAPISLGTESDGSIAMPAARAGLYAIKLSRGSVDTEGVQPALRPFDCLGGFTRSVTDLAHLSAIMQGLKPDHYFPLSRSWDGLKIGFVDPTLWRSYPAAIEPQEGFFEQTDAALFAAAEKIGSLGGKVIHSVPLASWPEITSALPDFDEMEDLNPPELRFTLNEFLKTFEGAPKDIQELIEFNNNHKDLEFTPRDDNQKLLEAARDSTMTPEIFDRNLKALRDKASQNVTGLLKEFDLDVIVGPCDSRTDSVGSASDFPTANLPLGFAHFNGRAFSLHMIAPRGHEAKMLQIMAAWEATFPENVRPPPLLYESTGRPCSIL